MNNGQRICMMLGAIKLRHDCGINKYKFLLLYSHCLSLILVKPVFIKNCLKLITSYSSSSKHIPWKTFFNLFFFLKFILFVLQFFFQCYFQPFFWTFLSLPPILTKVSLYFSFLQRVTFLKLFEGWSVLWIIFFYWKDLKLIWRKITALPGFPSFIWFSLSVFLMKH